MRIVESTTTSLSGNAQAAMRWNRKDLVGLRELSVDEINFILETADAFKQVGIREIKKVPALRGKTLVNFFVEPSTRTRTSFELAAFRLSADVINISATASSLKKGDQCDELTLDRSDGLADRSTQLSRSVACLV